MRFGLLISALLHASLVLVAAFGLPYLSTPPVIREQPLLVELVTIADETTPQVPPVDETREQEQEPKQQELTPPDVTPPPPPPKLAMAAPPVRPRLEAPPPPETRQQAVETPPPPPAMPKMEKRPPEAPKPPKLALAAPLPKPKAEPPPPPPAPAPKPVTATPPKMPKPPPPKPAAAPKPKAKPEPPKKAFDLNRIAALLDKTEREPAPKSPPETKTARRSAAKGQRNRAAGQESRELTIREIDALRLTIKRQIERCWRVPAGARDAENLVVEIRFVLQPDGSLARPPVIVDRARMIGAGGQFYRTAAESARTAVLKCSPLKGLPLENYDDWKEVALTFNPRDMLR